jgi:hypothetical protein
MASFMNCKVNYLNYLNTFTHEHQLFYLGIHHYYCSYYHYHYYSIFFLLCTTTHPDNYYTSSDYKNLFHDLYWHISYYNHVEDNYDNYYLDNYYYDNYCDNCSYSWILIPLILTSNLKMNF